MQNLLDIISATIIGGFILIMVARSNTLFIGFSDELLLSTITEFETVESLEVVEFDFYKIGYGANGKNIAIADSNEILFYTDLVSKSLPEGDGSLDSVRYIFDINNPMDTTNNPNDFPLYRITNNDKKMIIGRINEFKLSYYDSLSTEISMDSLKFQANRNKIKSINVLIEYQSSFPIDTTYKTVLWEKTIRPRNL